MVAVEIKPFPGDHSSTKRATESLLLTDCLIMIVTRAAVEHTAVCAIHDNEIKNHVAKSALGVIKYHHCIYSRPQQAPYQKLSYFASSHTLRAHSARHPADFPAPANALSRAEPTAAAAVHNSFADDDSSQKAVGDFGRDGDVAAVRMDRGMNDRKQ